MADRNQDERRPNYYCLISVWSDTYGHIRGFWGATLHRPHTSKSSRWGPKTSVLALLYESCSRQYIESSSDCRTVWRMTLGRAHSLCSSQQSSIRWWPQLKATAQNILITYYLASSYIDIHIEHCWAQVWARCAVTSKYTKSPIGHLHLVVSSAPGLTILLAALKTKNKVRAA